MDTITIITRHLTHRVNRACENKHVAREARKRGRWSGQGCPGAKAVPGDGASHLPSGNPEAANRDRESFGEKGFRCRVTHRGHGWTVSQTPPEEPRG